MRRRSLLRLAALSPAAFFMFRSQKAATMSAWRSTEDLRAVAVRLNELAGGMQTAADARLFVDAVAQQFESMPRPFTTNAVRDRVAQAEFLSVVRPERRIAEQRIVEVWNTFVLAVGGAADQQVSAAVVHNLRDALYTGARLSWKRGVRTMWSVPSIYATTAEDALAPGARTIEALRVLWDMGNMPQNLQAARQRERKGLLVSALMRTTEEGSSIRAVARGYVSAEMAKPNLVELATTRYIRNHGASALFRVALRGLDTLLS